MTAPLQADAVTVTAPQTPKAPRAAAQAAPAAAAGPQAAGVATRAPAGVLGWDIDPAHSAAEFAVKHLMISTVTGRFKGLQGTLHLDEARPEASRVEATVDVASVDTGDEKRDAHLRGPDFFDAAAHPAMTFRSKRVDLGPEPGTAVIVGDLTLRGVTREVVLSATLDGTIVDPWGNRRAAFSAEGTLNRKDFGLHWNMALETGGVLVGDKVRVTLRVAAVQRKA